MKCLIRPISQAVQGQESFKPGFTVNTTLNCNGYGAMGRLWPCHMSTKRNTNIDRKINMCIEREVGWETILISEYSSKGPSFKDYSARIL